MSVAVDPQGFKQDGFYLAKGLFEYERDIRPLKEAYRELVDTLIAIFSADLGEDGYSAADKSATFEDRFATLLGIAGGVALCHLDPAGCMSGGEYSFRRDLPNAHVQALHAINFNPKLLDVLQTLLGDEVHALLCTDFSLRLNAARQERADAIARAGGKGAKRVSDSIHKKVIGTAPWRIPAVDDLGISLSSDSDVIHAIVFLNPCSSESGGIKLLKGSHRIAIRRWPMHDELRGIVQISAEPGDVLFISHRLFIGSNINKSEQNCSWYFSCRFLPKGQSRPQPFLPCFLARSREQPEEEMRNATLWAAVIRQSLLHAAEHKPVRALDWVTSKSGMYRRAKSLVKLWQPFEHRPLDWLSLKNNANADTLYRRALRLVGVESK